MTDDNVAWRQKDRKDGLVFKLIDYIFQCIPGAFFGDSFCMDKPFVLISSIEWGDLFPEAQFPTKTRPGKIL